ncbi:MAG: hypothetical protein Q9220_005012 [cf. Caloplaca sp. 1 TL-2023]
MATGELDIPRLSTFCGVPQTSISSLLDAPTANLIRNLLESLSPRIREYDEAKAEKLKANIELENAVRGGEFKSRVLKNSVDKGSRENAELKHKLQEAETSRAAAESEFESLKSSTANSTTEISALHARISSLESSNRDTLSLLESKSAAYDRLSEELNAQHQKTLDLRKEVSSLEQKVQTADTAASSTKYHEQSLEQEIEQLKRNNDWLDRELKAKTDEYTKYRKDKSSRISDLQRQNDEATNKVDAARRTDQTLRNRIEELGQKIEEYLTRIQQMSEEATRAEESHKKNAESNKRLIELTQNAASTDRARLQEVQDELEATKENAQDHFGKLASDLQSESNGREAAEGRIGELESRIERLEGELNEAQHRQTEFPLHDGTNGQPATPDRGGSPASAVFSPARSRLKGGLSVTQLYTQNSELKTQLAVQRQENERLSASVDEMLQTAESMRPEIEEVRTEKSQLESNVADMSSLVDYMGKERDQAVKSARKAAGQIEAKIREGEVLRQQLRDLSTQTKILLFELDRRNKGLDDFSSDQQLQLEHLARGEADSVDITDTDRFIAAELVMFRNTAELQEQNTKLLKLTRELGARMEQEEALQKEAEAGQRSDDYKQLYEQCQDELKSMLTQSQSYILERDMFRRMLTHRGQLPRDEDTSSNFGDSVDGSLAPATLSQSQAMRGIEQAPHAKDMADYAKLLKDMQIHFDNYRKEAATDHKTLKEQVDGLSTSNGELRSEVSRSNSQVTLAQERYQMLQSNFAMLKTENSELQRRSQYFSENAAKQDLRTQQVAEDLVEAKGLLDSMRNENANLRAEKEFFKTIEKRLTADNEAHFAEKSRLNSLNASLQSLVNEREQTEGETRRRLQGRVENLEQELEATKRASQGQAEEQKRQSDRREYDHQQSQKKIDDLIASLGSIREELAGAKTARDHLQARVDELTIELRSSEERVQLLQPTPSKRLSGSAEENSLQPNGDEEQNVMSKEQELAVEVSELKRDLDLAKTDLVNSKVQVEQYKSISQASEEELQSLNETQDLYRQEVDTIMGERNSKIQELEQRVSDIHAELVSTNSELTRLLTKEAEISRQVQEQKTTFDAEIAKLKDQDDRHATAAKFHQEDLRAQADIAQQAQQNYENELVKHAEAAKALQRTRSDLNELKLQMIEQRTQAESARTSLAQSEESWLDSKAKFEQELSDLKQGKQNLADQNDRLHQQLETLGSQLANLQQKRPESGERGENEDQVTSSGLDNLQEVIKYLRREKEIVDVQLELSAQEGKRLKQQLDYTQAQLDDTRLKLNQQRRIEQDSERSALSHTKLMDTINELNTFRESNVTLRNESRQAQISLAQRIREVEQLVAQVEPLQSKVRDLQNQHEGQAEETRLLQEDRDRWRQRTQDILQKYDRIDPSELEALKNQLQTLQSERDEIILSKQALQEQVDGIEGQIAQVHEQNKERVEELKSRLTDQFKTRSKNLTGTIREKEAALLAATQEKQTLEQRLANLQQEFEKSMAEKEQAVQAAANTNAGPANANAQTGSEDGQVDEEEPSKPNQATAAQLQDKLLAAETRVNEEVSRNEQLQTDVATANARITELLQRIQIVQQKLDETNGRLEQLQNQASKSDEATTAVNPAEQRSTNLQQELEQARQEVKDLRSATSGQMIPSDDSTVEGGKPLVDVRSELRSEIQAELEARHSERVREADEKFQKRSQAMQSQLTKKLTEGKDQLRREKEEALQALRSAHEAELEGLKQRHREELDELKRQEETRFIDFKTTWVAEHDSKQSVDESSNNEAQLPGASWTDAEVRKFLASNTTTRQIMSTNLRKKVGEAETALATRLNEEHTKDMAAKLEEAQAKANTAKEQAVNMEGKKVALKVTLTENKFKVAQYRLDIVAKAASDTPAKPVVEVWEVAKGSKPVNPTGPQTLNSPGIQNPMRSNSVSQQAPNQAPQPVQNQAPPQPKFFGQPAPLRAVQQPEGQSENAQNASVNGPQDPPQVNSSNPKQDEPVAVPTQSTTAAQQSDPPANSDQQTGATQPASSLPIKQQEQPQTQIGNHPNAGTGPAALRGLHQSGLPVARGGNFNRGGRARGQAGGRGRGGAQSVSTNPGQNLQQQAAASPTQLSGAAKQFVPQGNKRPREDSEGGGGQHGGGDGKRVRGGAGES